MKKIVMIVISMMILLPNALNAQIKKTGSFKAETIASVRMGVVNLRKAEGDFYLAMQTTNQFDDAMILKLGDTKESALQSLNDLVDIMESLQGSEMQQIDNGYGTNFRLWKDLGTLYFSADGYAGNGNIAKFELKKFIKALQK